MILDVTRFDPGHPHVQDKHGPKPTCVLPGDVPIRCKVLTICESPKD